MENKICACCGYYGVMLYVHGINHCPKCHYAQWEEDQSDEQDLYDDEYIEESVLRVSYFTDQSGFRP
ncbi:MAG: hypothetical protein JNL57_11930 [Bacteroidetes bacterium]|nr:hypothetical protein [Bacteroidota bacterium]